MEVNNSAEYSTIELMISLINEIRRIALALEASNKMKYIETERRYPNIFQREDELRSDIFN